MLASITDNALGDEGVVLLAGRAFGQLSQLRELSLSSTRASVCSAGLVVLDALEILPNQFILALLTRIAPVHGARAVNDICEAGATALAGVLDVMSHLHMLSLSRTYVGTCCFRRCL